MIVYSESEEPVSLSHLYEDLTIGREFKGKRWKKIAHVNYGNPKPLSFFDYCF